MKKILSIRFLVPSVIFIFVVFSLGYSYFSSQQVLKGQILSNNIRIMRDQLNYIQTSTQQLLTVGNRDNVQQLISSFGSQPDIEILFITDSDGIVISSIHYRQINRHWSEIDHKIDYKLIQEVTGRNKNEVRIQHNSMIGFVGICSNVGNALRVNDCGFVYYKKNLEYHYFQAQQNIISTIKYAGSGIFIGGGILFIGLTFFLTRRVDTIVSALRLFTSGDRNVKLNIKGHDELSSISNSINTMFDVIRESESVIKNKTNELERVNIALAKSSVTDALTGIYNRRYFNKNIANELARAGRENTPLSLIMCDIDYFKRLNDTLGHQAGDNCLVEVAHILKASFPRSGDVVTRYGGEEFAVILPNTDVTQAKKCAERLLQNVWNENILHPDSDVADRLTLSIGVATYKPKEDNKETPHASELIVNSDRALYLAKQNGRNRIESKVKLTEVKTQ